MQMTILASGFNSPFAASSQCQPGYVYSAFLISAKVQKSLDYNYSLLDAADAQSVVIPHLVLASKDEELETVAAYQLLVVPKGGAVETYSTMWRGWMGSQTDLEKEGSRAEYVRG
jgi:uncharacterized LabA/DUF88 family protein